MQNARTLPAILALGLEKETTEFLVPCSQFSVEAQANFSIILTHLVKLRTVHVWVFPN